MFGTHRSSLPFFHTGLLCPTKMNLESNNIMTRDKVLPRQKSVLLLCGNVPRREHCTMNKMTEVKFTTTKHCKHRAVRTRQCRSRTDPPTVQWRGPSKNSVSCNLSRRSGAASGNGCSGAADHEPLRKLKRACWRMACPSWSWWRRAESPRPSRSYTETMSGDLGKCRSYPVVNIGGELKVPPMQK